MDVKECGRLGNTLAAEVIMHPGARPGVSIADIELRIE
jgi:sugar/nucleoside kinase (ribokinase family)